MQFFCHYTIIMVLFNNERGGMKRLLFVALGFISGMTQAWGEEVLVPSLETKKDSEFRALPYAQCMVVWPGFGVAVRKGNIQYDVNIVFGGDSNLAQASISGIYFPNDKGFNVGAGFAVGAFGNSRGAIPGIGVPLFIGYEGERAFLSLDVTLSISPISYLIIGGGPPIIPLPALKAGFIF